MSYPLEPDESQMRAMVHEASEAVVRFISGLDDAPSWDDEGAEVFAARFREPAPENGESFDRVLARFMEGTTKGIDSAAPGFFGFIPGGGIYSAAIAGFLAFATNRFVNLWDTAPALAQIESTVIRWIADLFEFPPETLGTFTSGGSIANLSAIVTARSVLLGEEFADGTMYTSEHAHASVQKAAMIAGFPVRNVRVVPCNEDLRINVDVLHAMVDADRREGFRPFCVVANAGTTNTGTVDPLVDLVQIAHERRMWVHVDAAYGGFFQLTARGRRALRGISGADSITLDPHKALFLPYGTGLLLVRDGDRLREAHEVEAHYMQDMNEARDRPNLMHYGPELSRDFRGLRVWLPIKLHGLGAFRDALDEKLDLARFVYDELSATPGFELPWEPDLSVVTFRYRFAEADQPDEQDELNRRLLDAINATRRVFLTSTKVGGRFVLRVCILSHRSHRDRVEELVEIIKRCAATLDR